MTMGSRPLLRRGLRIAVMGSQLRAENSFGPDR